MHKAQFIVLTNIVYHSFTHDEEITCVSSQNCALCN